ncbi:MAG: serine/threonine protein kinase [Alphaproteobacteria bacterium]|nr:serine/threonine protein kinase [Alphaproteobacteria bacterium]
MELATGSLQDRYVVVGELGRGGMAVVYLARHARLGSDHVLKVLAGPAGRLQDRLVLEGRVQARLKHPNIVEVTDMLDLDGRAALVMQYVRGPSLDAMMRSGVVPRARLEALLPAVFAGVAAAHAEGVVHRDLKPANILLSLERGRVVPKVADFGLVKQLEAGTARTGTGAMLGTPQYMAPEQIENARDVDTRADVWALGVMLYELATGELPFNGSSHYEIFKAVTARRFVPVRDVRPDVPDAVAEAIGLALSERDARPADVATLYAVLAGGASLDDVPPGVPWSEAELEAAASIVPVVGPLSPSDATWAASTVATAAHDSTFVSIGSAMPLLSTDTLPAEETAEIPMTLDSVAPVEPAGGPVADPSYVGLAGLAGGLLVALAFGVYLYGARVEPEAVEAPETPVVAPPAPPPVVPDPVPLEAPSEAPVPPDPPDVPVLPDRPARPAPVPRPVAAPVEAPATGTLVLEGGGTVRFVGPAGTFGPGDVPAGRYQVELLTPEGFERGPSVDVPAGGRAVVRCDPDLRGCRVR